MKSFQKNFVPLNTVAIVLWSSSWKRLQILLLLNDQWAHMKGTDFCSFQNGAVVEKSKMIIGRREISDKSHFLLHSSSDSSHALSRGLLVFSSKWENLWSSLQRSSSWICRKFNLSVKIFSCFTEYMRIQLYMDAFFLTVRRKLNVFFLFWASGIQPASTEIFASLSTDQSYRFFFASQIFNQAPMLEFLWPQF